jgi:hypothetical protein
MHAPTRALLVPMVAALAGSLTDFAVADPADTSGADTGDRGGVLQEVVVTAEKRSSTVQDTPISMTAVTGDLMQQQGITNQSQRPHPIRARHFRTHRGSRSDRARDARHVLVGRRLSDGRLLPRRLSPQPPGGRPQRQPRTIGIDFNYKF